MWPDGTATMRRDPQISPRDHKVVLYEDDHQFVRAIGEFASDALADGGAVVLLATGDQLEAAEEWIELSCDAADSVGPCGRFVSIDVEAVADELIEAEEPARVFEEVLTRACVEVGTQSTTVHIFGGLVGELWQRGKPDVAASIESLGNRLADERGASILCAYPTTAMADHDDVDRVESCHSDVLSAPPVPCADVHHRGADSDSATVDVEFARVFPAAVPACRAARHFVRSILESHASNEDVIDAIELICSELSANAVRHAHSVFTVALAYGPTRVRIAVADATPPAPEDSSFPVRTGRGLGIVAALSRQWGIEHDEAGHAVWAEVGEETSGSLPPPSTAAFDLFATPTYGEPITS